MFINGTKVNASVEDLQKFILNAKLLKQGINTINIFGTPVHKIKIWYVINADPGMVQLVTPAAPYKRKLFNGYAQIIVQADGSGKPLELTAKSVGVKEAKLTLQTEK